MNRKVGQASRLPPVSTADCGTLLALTPLARQAGRLPYFGRESIYRALGQTRRFAERVNLAKMIPQNELASTAYCLANPGEEYLIYQPKSGEAFSVELSAGKYRYEWFNAAQGAGAGEASVESDGKAREFKAPFAGDAVLYLKRQANP